MAKVNVNFNEKKFALTVRQTFQKVKQSKQLQNEIGQFLSDRIKAEAKRGTPLNRRRKYPALKQTSIEQRKRLGDLNPTGRPFRPSFSNTTLSGQLLNSITFKAGRDSVTIGPQGRRKPLVISSKGTREKLIRGVNATNQELAVTLAKIGFVIFDAQTIQNESKIVSRLKNITLKFLRRALKVSKLRS